MPCFKISSDGPIPDLSIIWGDPNAPDDNRTSLLASRVKNSPFLSIHSTAHAFLFWTTILLTFVSVSTVKFSLSRHGTKYALAALHLFPSFWVVW